MTVRDRGSKKWVSIFPTELVTLLREWRNEDSLSKRPELDAYDMDTIQEQINLAQTRQCDIQITTWREGLLVHHEGVIQEVSTTLRQMYLEKGPNVTKIRIDEIVGANILE